MSNRINIQTTYWIQPESNGGDANSGESILTKSFGPSPQSQIQPMRMNLPEGIKPEKQPAGEVGYSGMHDHGPLPPLREGGPMAELMTCLQDAKNFNDQYLTDLIAARKNSKNSKSSPPVKRPKLEGA